MHRIGRKARRRWRRRRRPLLLVACHVIPYPAVRAAPSGCLRDGMSGQYRQDAARLPPQSLAKRRMARHARAQFIILGTHPMSRSEEHTSELQSLMRISYAVFCLKKKTNTKIQLENNRSPDNKS